MTAKIRHDVEKSVVLETHTGSHSVFLVKIPGFTQIRVPDEDDTCHGATQSTGEPVDDTCAR